jgi:molybdate transport system regulatory protein
VAKFTYKLMLMLTDGEPFTGRGCVRLLKLIQSEGSILAASNRMEMSYNKAWRLVKRTEEKLDCPLVQRQAGATHGSTLTAQALLLIQCYQELDTLLQACAEQHFTEIFAPLLDGRQQTNE